MLAKERGQECVFGVGNDEAKPPMLTAASPGSAVWSKHMHGKQTLFRPTKTKSEILSHAAPLLKSSETKPGQAECVDLCKQQIGSERR